MKAAHPSRSRALFCAAALAAMTALTGMSSPCQAALTLRPGGLSEGDLFRVLFISSARRDALSSDIAAYDSFIASLAASAGIDTYFGTPVTWQVLGSTFAVSAIDRVALDSVALFSMSGVKVADSGADLWDGSIDAPIQADEGGRFNEGLVHTGTRPDGRAADDPLGGRALLITELGLSSTVVTDRNWVSAGAGSGASRHFLYGVSSVLTVPPALNTVPVPGSLALAALALLALAATAQVRQR